MFYMAEWVFPTGGHGMERVYEKNLVEIFAVSPGVYFRKADLVTRGQCNGAYFFDNGRVGVLDIPTEESAQEIVEECQLLFGHPVSYIFITHGHEDHIGGLPFFLDQPVTVFCAERLVDRVLSGGRARKAAVVGVRGSMRVRLAGLEVECRTLDGTAHSPWDMVVRVPRARLLCTGDAVVDLPVLYYHNADVENWIANLRALSDGQDQLILPGHGGIYPCSKVGETADFIETLRGAAQRCLARLSADEIRSISEDRINEIVAGFLSGSERDAPRIRELVGAEAARELRMVFRNLLYKELR
jgi:glyoxylase-like metal-dependent hydrolase (beta-lactamase superfamily II)